MYVYMYLYIHACVCVYIYTHTHRYIYILSFTYYVSSRSCEVNPVKPLIKIILVYTLQNSLILTTF